MKKALITVLRNKNTEISEYRHASHQLGLTLAVECDEVFLKQKIFIDTPLAKTEGEKLTATPLLIPILRSGLVLLPPFLEFYPNSPIGFLGLRRDETTAKAHSYYVKLPLFTAETHIILLDPMIATGGSAILAVDILKEKGAREEQITLVSFIGAKEGIEALKKRYPQVRVIVAQVDEQLDTKKRIVPGLGDFGDRYFGTEE